MEFWWSVGSSSTRAERVDIQVLSYEGSDWYYIEWLTLHHYVLQ